METAFFWRWWEQQDEETQDLVSQLVSAGQLEFTGGGWSMNDEGAAHYSAIIDNMALGLRRLNDTFGECGVPRVAWQIDPFGHSKEQANLFAMMGFDGLFFARLDWRDKERRLAEQSLEMVWEASRELGDTSDLFTGVLYDHYGPPAGFCWDLICNDAPMMDSREAEGENNVENRTREFLDYVRLQAGHYRSNNIMLTMGMDFNYQAAHAWFMNLDKLIQAVTEADPGVNIFYSTPACYLKSLQDSEISWPTKQDDFLPYASDPHAYWSGYFSSRPTSKFMIRQTERLHKIFSQLGLLQERRGEGLAFLEETVGVVQHHDAVTGTEKQAVADNYHSRLHRALVEAGSELGLSLSLEAGGLTVCPLLNISQCSPSETFQSQLVLSVYNPLARQRVHYARLPVRAGGEYEVVGQDGAQLDSQLVPLPPQLLSLPGRDSEASHLLVFRTVTAPLSLSHFTITRTESSSPHTSPATKTNSRTSRLKGKKKQSIGRNKKRLYVEEGSSRVFYRDLETQLETQLDMELLYYRAHRGDNSEFAKRASGAYIFRPETDTPVSFGSPNETVVTEGPVVDEVIRTFEDSWVTQVVRVYHQEDMVEVDWLVGPIPVNDQVGKEVIVRFCSDLMATEEKFSTDSNGRQLVERRLNSRPSYEINMTEPVAQNYYPVNSKILLADSASQMGLLTDRSQGGSSLADGCLELMVHRRLLDDDAFGVGEALNEEAFGVGLVATGRHALIVSSDEQQFAREHRVRALDIFHEPLLIFGDLTEGENFPQLPRLAVPLPENLHLLTLRKLEIAEDPFGNYLFLQIEHIFQENEHAELSQPVTVDLANLFDSSSLFVESFRETTLAGHVWRDQLERLNFNKNSNKIPQERSWEDSQDWQITLRPMDIRSFIVKYL